jgi:hypothetical protein
VAKNSSKICQCGYLILLNSFTFSLREERGGLNCRTVELEPVADPPRRPPEVTDHVDYIKDLAVRQLCDEAIKEIQKLDSDIEVKPTAYAISFKHANRVIASIYTKNSSGFSILQRVEKTGSGSGLKKKGFHFRDN